jgi:hypothetical protein
VTNTAEKTPCVYEPDLFYSPEEDGRTEIGRIEREALAGMICITQCPLRVECLYRALVTRQDYGVWGGMGEGERRDFRDHLISEGYSKREIPELADLKSSMIQFYLYYPTAEERLYPELQDYVA